MERLKLDELPGRIWEHCQEAVEEMLGHAGLEPDSYMLGGGTLLAARFGHRESTDVDLIVPNGIYIEEWTTPDPEEAKPGGADQGPAEKHFRSKMEEHGAWIIPNAERGIVFAFFNLDGELAELDIKEGRPDIPYGHAEARVDGRTETVLSTAQVLAGKLHRGAKMPARDAYDFVLMQRTDPASLEVAVNDVGPRKVGRVSENWSERNEALAEEARDVKRGIFIRKDCRYGTADVNSLGTEATQAVRSSLYREIRVRTQRGMVEVETTTEAGARRTRSGTPEQSNELLTIAGLRGHAPKRPDHEPEWLTETARVAEAAAKQGRDVVVAQMRSGGEWERNTEQRKKRRANRETGATGGTTTKKDQKDRSQV